MQQSTLENMHKRYQGCQKVHVAVLLATWLVAEKEKIECQSQGTRLSEPLCSYTMQCLMIVAASKLDEVELGVPVWKDICMLNEKKKKKRANMHSVIIVLKKNEKKNWNSTKALRSICVHLYRHLWEKCETVGSPGVTRELTY